MFNQRYPKKYTHVAHQTNVKLKMTFKEQLLTGQATAEIFWKWASRSRRFKRARNVSRCGSQPKTLPFPGKLDKRHSPRNNFLFIMGSYAQNWHCARCKNIVFLEETGVVNTVKLNNTRLRETLCREKNTNDLFISRHPTSSERAVSRNQAPAPRYPLVSKKIPQTSIVHHSDV